MRAALGQRAQVGGLASKGVCVCVCVCVCESLSKGVCVCVCVCESLSHVPLFVTPCTVCQVALSMGFSSKNTGVGCHSLRQGIFPTQGSNPSLLHCMQIGYRLSHQGIDASDFGEPGQEWSLNSSLTCHQGLGRTRGWVLFALEGWCRSCRGFLSQGEPSTLAFRNLQLTHPLVRANVAEVVGQWLGGGYWLGALKHWVIPKTAGTQGSIPDTSTLSKERRKKKKSHQSAQDFGDRSVGSETRPIPLWKDIVGKFYHIGKPGFFSHFFFFK